MDKDRRFVPKDDMDDIYSDRLVPSVWSILVSLLVAFGFVGFVMLVVKGVMI